MTKFIQEGEILEYSNSGSAISSGDVVVVGNRIGVAIADIAATTGKGSLRMEGVHYLTKTTSQTWSLGDTLFWDTNTSKITNVPTAYTKMAGYAFLAAGSSDTSGYVMLTSSQKQASSVESLTGTLTGTANGSMVDIAATAGACAGGATPAASDVDTAIATAVASIVTGVNTQNKELMTTLNAVIVALKAAGLMST